MRCCSLLLLAAVAAALPGQSARLVDAVEQPLAYLCLAAAGPGAASREPGPVRKLLADPALDAVFGGSPAASEGSALALVRGVLARTPGELELVLTGILPKGGQPLLLLRARLQGKETARLGRVLADGQLAAPGRRIGDRETFVLRSGRADTAAAPGGSTPGAQVELALVGDDLLVGNDGSAMSELLALPAQTSASPRAGSLAADPRFVALRAQSNPQPGGLWLYADWRRLGGRMPQMLSGMHGALVGSSGLAAARAVVASIGSSAAATGAASPGTGGGASAHGTTTTGTAAMTPAADLLAADFVVEFDIGNPGLGSDRVLRGPGIDGWLNAIQPAAPKALAAELPASGLGGLVLSVNLATVARRSCGGSHLLREVEFAFRRYGLDFQRQLLDRLGTRGTLQLQLGRGDAAATVNSIYAVRVQNRGTAADIFADLRRVCTAEGLGQLVPRDSKDPKALEALEVRSPHHDAQIVVVAHDDMLLLAPTADVLFAFVDDLRAGEGKGARVRGRRDQAAAAVVAAGRSEVAGMFDLDLEPLFQQLASALASAGAKLDLSQLPKRHSGFVDLQRGPTGSLVRVSVLSKK